MYCLEEIQFLKAHPLVRASRQVLGPTQPPIQCVPRALSPAVKLTGHEANHSPPDSAEVNKMWIYTSTDPYAIMAQCVSTGTTLP
jgi:hypothetical protein